MMVDSGLDFPFKYLFYFIVYPFYMNDNLLQID